MEIIYNAQDNIFYLYNEDGEWVYDGSYDECVEVMHMYD